MTIAREVEAVVASSPKVRDVQLDWNDPVRTLKVDLDQDKARALGLAPADVAFVTQTVMNGATMSHLREHEDLIDIVARAVPSERLDLDTLKDVNLFTRQGTVVPLSQVARVRYELEEPVLWRRNRDMAITVRADVKDGEQGVSVTQSIRPLLKDIEAKLPFGYRIDVGGAVEESDKANRALMAVVPGDAGHDPDDPDAAAPELLHDVHGVPDRAARTHRGRRRAASFSRRRSASSRSSASPRSAG